LLIHTSVTLYSDDAIYAELARFATQGQWYRTFHPTWSPLFPTVSSLIYPFFESWETTLRFISILSGIATLIPLYFLAKSLLSRPQAVVFILITSFLIPLLDLSIFPLSDTLSTFFAITGITFIFFGLKRNIEKYYYFGSFFFGLTYLTRSEGTVYFFFTLLFLSIYFSFLCFIRHDKKTPYFRSLLLFVIIFLITVSPYLIATKNQLGKWTLSHKVSAQFKQGHAFQVRENTGLTWIQEVVSVKTPNYKSEYFTGGISYIIDNLDWYMFWFGEKSATWSKVFKENFPLWSTPIILIGSLKFLQKKNFWSFGYLVAILSFAIPLTIFATPLAQMRYLFWTIPFLMLLVFLGIDLLIHLILPKPKGITILLATVAAVLMVTKFPSFDKALIFQPKAYIQAFTNIHKREEIYDSGVWLKENSKSTNPKIMMLHEGIEFYADGETIYIPQNHTIDEVIIYGKKLKAQYIIAWTEELSHDKNLSVLLTENYTHPNLKRIYKTESNGRKVIIYEIY